MKLKLVFLRDPCNYLGPARSGFRNDVGLVEWGSECSALEKVHYMAGDLALCHRHVGEWGLMN